MPFKFDRNSLAGILGYIIIPADTKMTAKAVAEAINGLAKEKSGDLVWERFADLAKALQQSEPAGKTMFSFSDRPGGVVSVMTQAPSADVIHEILFQLGAKTGEVMALVVANNALARDRTAQKAIQAAIAKQAQTSFDHNGIPVGERISISFSSENPQAATAAVHSAAAVVGKSVNGTSHVVVLVNELPAMIKTVGVGTVLDGTGEAGRGQPEYATLRHWISGEVAQLVDASKNASDVAEALSKELEKVVIQVRGNHLWLDEKELAGLKDLLSKINAIRVISVAA